MAFTPSGLFLNILPGSRLDVAGNPDITQARGRVEVDAVDAPLLVFYPFGGLAYAANVHGTKINVQARGDISAWDTVGLAPVVIPDGTDAETQAQQLIIAGHLPPFAYANPELVGD